MDERWIDLLDYWKTVELRHSLTFPFLIGAMRTPIGAADSPCGDARKELQDLLNVMRAHPANGYFHHVYRCHDLGQLVVTKIPDSVPPSSAIKIPSPQADMAPSLFASDGVRGDSNSPLACLVETIWNEVGSAIENGHFSCRGKQFGTFNDYELRVIQSALA